MLEYNKEDTVKSIVQRGDSFDIGGSTTDLTTRPDFVELLQNPNQLAEMLGLNKDQAENLRAAITAAGAGLSSKFLAGAFGDEIAGAIGGFLGGHIAKKMIGK